MVEILLVPRYNRSIGEMGGMDIRAHTVILGAGATMAAIPNGDRYGKKSSVMNGMISKLGLDDLLVDVELETKSENIEDIYSELCMKHEYVDVVRELVIERNSCCLSAFAAATSIPSITITYSPLGSCSS